MEALSAAHHMPNQCFCPTRLQTVLPAWHRTMLAGGVRAGLAPREYSASFNSTDARSVGASREAVNWCGGLHTSSRSRPWWRYLEWPSTGPCTSTRSQESSTVKGLCSDPNGTFTSRFCRAHRPWERASAPSFCRAAREKVRASLQLPFRCQRAHGDRGDDLGTAPNLEDSTEGGGGSRWFLTLDDGDAWSVVKALEKGKPPRWNRFTTQRVWVRSLTTSLHDIPSCSRRLRSSRCTWPTSCSRMRRWTCESATTARRYASSLLDGQTSPDHPAFCARWWGLPRITCSPESITPCSPPRQPTLAATAAARFSSACTCGVATRQCSGSARAASTETIPTWLTSWSESQTTLRSSCDA